MRRTFLLRAALASVLACALAMTLAKEAAPVAEDPVLEARMQDIAAELRCLVCQNETIAASSADLAVDLRNQVRTMLSQGKSDREIIDYMTARYGDFVLYRPPVKGTTMVLWFGPIVLLLGAVAALIAVLRKRSRMSDDQFELDDDEEEQQRQPQPPAAR